MAYDNKANNELRKKELSELVLRNAEQLSFPPTKWEADTLEEVLALPRVTATRPPKDELLAAGMEINNCHSNCSAQAANDPTGLSRHVYGWLIYGTDLIFHSVVESGEQWLCLTPQLLAMPSQFQFIPDPLIEWRETSDGRGRDPFRRGVRLPQGLRKYPEHHIQMRGELHKLMASGMSAVDAQEMLNATLGRELRKKDPI